MKVAHSLLLELKQLNQVARGIFQQPSATGPRLADFPSKFGPSSAQAADETVDVFRNDHEPVPSAGLGGAAGSSSTASPRGAQVERQIIANQRRELAGVVHVDPEFELIAIEFDRSIDVRHDVSDGGHCPRSLFATQVDGSTHRSVACCNR